ncbi:MAG: hypothetical protein HY000_32435 [Planctomycetes bacterium]|nr:hypothetical protein [Planctomycetota bacterium]
MFRTSSLLARNGRSRRLRSVHHAARPKSRPSRRFAFEPLEERTLLSAEGMELWSFSDPTFSAVDVAPDPTSGKTYLAGTNQGANQIWKVARLNADGTLDTFFPDSDNPGGGDVAKAAVVGPDGSVYVAGVGYNVVSSKSKLDLVVRKYSSSGTLLWQKGFDGGGDDDSGAIAGQSESGGFFVYVTGSLRKPTGGPRGYTTKLDANGNVASGWPRDFFSAKGGSTSDTHSIALDSAGNVYVGGGIYNLASASARIVKYSTTGSVLATAQYSPIPPARTEVTTGFFNGVEYLWSAVGGATASDPPTLSKRNLSDLSVHTTGGCHGQALVSSYAVLGLRVDSRGGVDNLYVGGSGSDNLRQFHMNPENTCVEDNANWPDTAVLTFRLEVDTSGNLYVVPGGSAGFDAKKFQGPGSAAISTSAANTTIATSSPLTESVSFAAPVSLGVTPRCAGSLRANQPQAMLSPSGGSVAAHPVPQPAPAPSEPASANPIDRALAELAFGSLDDALLADLALGVFA